MWQFLEPNSLTEPNGRGDIYGGITSAIVALPLAMALGVASGAGAQAGLIGAAMLGTVAAIFGGTPAQISGPTAPMAIVVALAYSTFADNPGTLTLVLVMAGALQILFAFFKLGQYVAFIPSAVVAGFMTGIGLSLIKLQVAGLLVADNNYVPMSDLTSFLQDTVRLPWSDIIILLMTLSAFSMSHLRISNIVPTPLLALIFGVVTGVFLPEGTFLEPLTAGNWAFPEIAWGLEAISSALPLAVFLAFLGSIDSLLTSIVADTIAETKHDAERELFGQGLGNIVASALGGIPGAGATVRTVTNIRAGGHSARSGVFHALIIVGVFAGLGNSMSLVPQACLSGILLKIGWDIADWKYIANLKKIPTEKALIFVLVAGLTVFTDLLLAVVTGLVVSSLVSAKNFKSVQMQHLHIRRATGINDHRLSKSLLFGQALSVTPEGSFTYASARSLKQAIVSAAEKCDVIVFDFRKLTYLELSNALAIRDTIDTLDEQGVLIYIVDPGLEPTELLRHLDAFQALPKSHFLPIDCDLS